MEPTQKPKGNAKDFFINLGAIVALYTVVISLVNLLFTIIDSVYPKITADYYYGGSSSISWPVAILLIFFPIFITLMWLMAKQYAVEPERKEAGIHKWLTYITLFVSGIAMAGDLITVIYYFINGENLTTGFLLKVLVLLIITFAVFMYYISDIRGKLTSKSRKIWRIVALVVVLGSIVWGFIVLGSPQTQRLLKYDDQKVNDLMSINNEIVNYYSTKGALPKTLADLANGNYYIPTVDSQSQKPYEYEKTSNITYNLCAEFNKSSPEATQPNIYARPIGYTSWTHPAGGYCFKETINPNNYIKGMPAAIPVQ